MKYKVYISVDHKLLEGMPCIFGMLAISFHLQGEEVIIVMNIPENFMMRDVIFYYEVLFDTSFLFFSWFKFLTVFQK